MLLRLRLFAAFVVMSFGALVMLLVAIITLFQARRFYSEVIGAAVGRAVLALWGIRFVVHHHAPLPKGQTIFVSNHASAIDVFVLIALAMPRTRFFLSGFLKWKPPIGVIGTLVRIFWTVPQAFPEERRRIFARADRILRRTGDSVYLSPEGRRVATGHIGHFNKGSFHLATSLHAPIVPIYIQTPAETNPGMGVDARPGILSVHFLPFIDTSSWRLENLEANRDRVHRLFLRVHDVVRTRGRLPDNLSIDAAEREPAEATA